MKIFVPGQPIAKARARARIVQPKGKKPFVQMYTPKDTVDYEQAISTYAKSAMKGKKPTLRPVLLKIILFFEIPESWPKWKKVAAHEGYVAHTSKPDSDNVLKAIKDALNKIVWHDDSQVINTTIEKYYAEKNTVIGALIETEEYAKISPCQITKKSDLLAIMPGLDLNCEGV